jgi:hypothetical protein
MLHAGDPNVVMRRRRRDNRNVVVLRQDTADGAIGRIRAPCLHESPRARRRPDVPRGRLRHVGAPSETVRLR